LVEDDMCKQDEPQNYRKNIGAFKTLVALSGSEVGVTNGIVHPKNISTLDHKRMNAVDDVFA
jgi:hypothetical protein